ncbi:MAG: HipA domain-containing protein [Fibrobacteria bacterium]|nr:HipA domain-containing protein [Fibrobacteria bacterium]
MAEGKKVYVYAHWVSLEHPELLGVLTSSLIRGKEIFQFSCSENWLRSGFAHQLDPDIRFFTGPQFLPEKKQNFGIFLDSSPDRWGRLLMRRREAIYARKEKRPARKLFEMDYLLGVFDTYRIGALRFKENTSGPFINNDETLAAPPFSRLRKLEFASLQIEKQDAFDTPDQEQWLNMLLAPGSSLGGARPKAGVLDENKELWIAKFPSLRDEWNMGAWEKLVHEVAALAGIQVPETKAIKLTGPFHTFLSKRFDRDSKGQRLHFASAMTMLGHTDGADAAEGASYLEIAEFLSQQGTRVTADLKQLWRRIVFNICISNTDDHLRNHGFLMGKTGWTLAPAYDINPNPDGHGLSLNINENSNALDLDLALEVAELFRVNNKQAKDIMQDVKNAVTNWPSHARKLKIPKAEQDLMESAFLAAK